MRVLLLPGFCYRRIMSPPGTKNTFVGEREMAEFFGASFKSEPLPPETSPGCIVHHEGKLAIVSISTDVNRSGTNARLLTVYDRNAGEFTITSYMDSRVLILGVDVSVQPDLSFPSEQGHLGIHSKNECYYCSKGLYVRAIAPAMPKSPVALNLFTGELSGAPMEKMEVFKHWRLGIRHNKYVTWILSVGVELSPWARDAL